MPIEPVEAKTLQKAILEEALWVMGSDRQPVLGRFVEFLFRPPIGRFSRLAADFENGVAQVGLRDTTRDFMGRFVSGFDIIGANELPTDGPLLIAANHPAAYDFFLIAAFLPRDDLKLVASDIKIVRQLPATREHFIFIGSGEVMGDSHSRMAAVRASVRHLREGGALLIFPTGTVDPDPAVNPVGAREALEKWSPSLNLFARRVPEVKIVVSVVSGVLSKRWFNSPVTWLRKEPHNKQKVAEIFQVMQQLFLPISLKIRPCISFSRPLTSDQYLEGKDVVEIIPALQAEAYSQLWYHIEQSS